MENVQALRWRAVPEKLEGDPGSFIEEALLLDGRVVETGRSGHVAFGDEDYVVDDLTGAQVMGPRNKRNV